MGSEVGGTVIPPTPENLLALLSARGNWKLGTVTSGKNQGKFGCTVWLKNAARGRYEVRAVQPLPLDAVRECLRKIDAPYSPRQTLKLAIRRRNIPRPEKFKNVAPVGALNDPSIFTENR